VPRGHEGRKVLEPVRVDAPDDRADHLAAGRNEDDGERLQPHRSRLEREERGEDARREHAEAELARSPKVLIEPESAGRPDCDDGERDGGQTAHPCIFVDRAVAVHAYAFRSLPSWENACTEAVERCVDGEFTERRNWMFGISLGGILVIVGIVLAIVWSLWIGIIVALIGLIAFGGFARGRWY